tara:strand:- start:3713 stop:3967 length:255 start_codon:yes stop_codon:yes gene_type:complete
LQAPTASIRPGRLLITPTLTDIKKGVEPMARFKNMLLRETEEVIIEAKKEGCFLQWEEAEYIAKRRLAHEVLMTTSDFDKSTMH